MLMVNLESEEVVMDRKCDIQSNLTSMIGLGGGIRGLLAIHCPSSVATAITGAFLGMEVENVDDDVKDAIGEIAKIFEHGIHEGIFVNKKPIVLADIAWAIYSGVVLWEDSKKILDDKKDFLKSTLKSAFEIFGHGIIKK